VLSIVGILVLLLWHLVQPLPLLVQGEVGATLIDLAAQVDGRLTTRSVHRGEDAQSGQWSGPARRTSRRPILCRGKVYQEVSMSIALDMTSPLADRALRLSLLITTAVVFAVMSARALHVNMDAISEFPLPICAADASSGNKVEVVNSYAIPDMPGKRMTVVRVTYGPGGFTPPHRHGGTVTAYITKGQIRSQLNDGPVEIFDVGQSFFEPLGTIHRVSANASNTEWAELIAVFVADEGAQLTTLIDP
jgi:quercetin dioxygenase-like cupin family protein